MNNKLLFAVVGFTLGLSCLLVSVGSSYADKPSSVTQICSFNMTDSRRSAAASDIKALNDSPSNFQVHEYFDPKKEPNIEHSFESFVGDQVDSDQHCDGLAITGNYSDQAVIEGDDKVEGVLNLATVAKLLGQPKFQAWAKAVKAIYFDGGFTSAAQSALLNSFPKAQYLGSPYNLPRDSVPTEQKTRTLLAQTFLKASAGEDVGSEEEQLQREYEWLKDSSRDPAKAAAQSSGQPLVQSSAQAAASLGSIGSLLDDAAKKLDAMTSPGVLFKAPQQFTTGEMQNGPKPASQ